MEQIVLSILHLNHKRLDLMAKIYIEGETKDQRKARKEADKLRKEKEKAQKSPPPEPVVVQSPMSKQDSNTKNYIVCLKHGSKYGSEYVNRLYNMTKRHCTIPFEFVCFTDDKRDINQQIRTINLKELGISGWWYKVIFFDKNFPLDGNILYFDLDVVIYDSIDKLWLHAPDKFSIIRDFNRSIRHDWNRFNSSVFKFRSGTLGYVYDNFVKDHAFHMRRFHGDQDWIYAQIKPEKGTWTFFPDTWIQSYKWEMRDRRELAKIGNHRNFTVKASPKLINGCCVAVFHGEPHPHQCEDDWVKENWQ